MMHFTVFIMVVIILHFCIDNDSAADSDPENAVTIQLQLLDSICEPS